MKGYYIVIKNIECDRLAKVHEEFFVTSFIILHELNTYTSSDSYFKFGGLHPQI